MTYEEYEQSGKQFECYEALTAAYSVKREKTQELNIAIFELSNAPSLREALKVVQIQNDLNSIELAISLLTELSQKHCIESVKQ